MDMVNIYGLWPDMVYCVWAVGRLYTALVAKRLITPLKLVVCLNTIS